MYWKLGYFWLYFGLLLGYLAFGSGVYEFVNERHNLHAVKSQNYNSCIHTQPFCLIWILFLIGFYWIFYFQVFQYKFCDVKQCKWIIGNVLFFCGRLYFWATQEKKVQREKNVKKKLGQNENKKMVVNQICPPSKFLLSRILMICVIDTDATLYGIPDCSEECDEIELPCDSCSNVKSSNVNYWDVIGPNSILFNGYVCADTFAVERNDNNTSITSDTISMSAPNVSLSINPSSLQLSQSNSSSSLQIVLGDTTGIFYLGDKDFKIQASGDIHLTSPSNNVFINGNLYHPPLQFTMQNAFLSSGIDSFPSTQTVYLYTGLYNITFSMFFDPSFTTTRGTVRLYDISNKTKITPDLWDTIHYSGTTCITVTDTIQVIHSGDYALLGYQENDSSENGIVYWNALVTRIRSI